LKPLLPRFIAAFRLRSVLEWNADRVRLFELINEGFREALRSTDLYVRKPGPFSFGPPLNCSESDLEASRHLLLGQ
jgi:hypothetical protein